MVVGYFIYNGREKSMEIGTIGSTTVTEKIYSASSSSISKSNFADSVAGASAAKVTKDKQEVQTDPIMDLYKSICEKYPDVSFRLDDQAARLDYEKKNGTNCCPYLGYNNSSNQVGDNFGKMSQKSCQIDSAVLKRCLEDPTYREEFEYYLDDTLAHYDSWKQRALEMNQTNMCVGFTDEAGKLGVYADGANTDFATDAELKSRWGSGIDKDALLQKIGSDNNELLENYMKLLSEHSQKLRERLVNGEENEFMIGSRTMSQEEWDDLLEKVDISNVNNQHIINQNA